MVGCPAVTCLIASQHKLMVVALSVFQAAAGAEHAQPPDQLPHSIPEAAIQLRLYACIIQRLEVCQDILQCAQINLSRASLPVQQLK